MEQTMIKKEQIIDAVKSIPTIAEKEKWVLTLDKEEGTLFYSPEMIPDNAELHQVTDEYALYLDKNHSPKGVMVEYYNVNFVKHHEGFEKLSSEIFKGKDSVKTIDPNHTKKDNITFLKALLETTLIKEADSSLIPA
jgi:hypothetical protein